jgi:hypothetical protein
MNEEMSEEYKSCDNCRYEELYGEEEPCTKCFRAQGDDEMRKPKEKLVYKLPAETKRERIHREICEELHRTYLKKNADYGDSFAKLRQKYPEAILIRLSDKLNRLKSLMESGNIQVKDESISDTLLDLANYCIMEEVERRKYEDDCTF